MEYDVMCPILKREIDNGYCCEITNAAYGIIKMECLDDKIDRQEAARLCEKCPHNQIK
jgi:hypothetical protein